MLNLSKKKKKIIVNSLTITRILGALSIPVVLALSSGALLAGVISLIFFTDFLDGKLARKWEVQTIGGSLLDPLGDKILTLSFIISSLATNTMLLIPLFLETGITITNIRSGYANKDVKSSKIGKLKTWVLSLTLIIAFLNTFSPEVLMKITEKLSITNQSFVNTAVLTTGVFETVTLASYTNNFESEVRKERIRDLKNWKGILERLFDETKFEEDKNRPIREILLEESAKERKCL